MKRAQPIEIELTAQGRAGPDLARIILGEGMQRVEDTGAHFLGGLTVGHGLLGKVGDRSSPKVRSGQLPTR